MDLRHERVKDFQSSAITNLETELIPFTYHSKKIIPIKSRSHLMSAEEREKVTSCVINFHLELGNWYRHGR